MKDTPDKYTLHQPPTTRVLNAFRKVFTIPAIEKLLVRNMINNGSWFVSKLIPPDYLYKKGSVRSVEREGIRYHLDISHVVDHCIYWGIKDLSFYRILDRIKQARVILDIGANIGNSSLFFASQNAAAKILAFEPHPETYKRAQVNIDLNPYQNIKLYNLGLGEEKAELKLYEVNEHNSGMNRILEQELDLPFKVVKVDRLDSFMEQERLNSVDLLKIDVEGYEYAVLKGAEETIKKHFPLLFIELDDLNLREQNRSAAELLQLLTDFGYTTFIRADTNEKIDKGSSFSACHYDMIALRE